MKKIDDAQLLAIFKAEADERLQHMNRSLLALEKKPDDETEMTELLREIHNLKGAARLAGFTKIGDLSHSIEDIFKSVKDGDISLDQVSDILFKSFDALQTLVDAAVTNTEPALNTDALDAILKSTLQSKARDERIQQSKQLGEILLEEKIISEEQLQLALKKQKETVLRELEETIRVSTRKLDVLANSVGEMVIDQSKFEGYVRRLNDATELARETNKQFTNLHDDIQMYIDDTKTPAGGELLNDLETYGYASSQLADKIAALSLFQQDIASTLKITTDKLQNQIMALRMLPVSTVFDLFPRTVHDLAGEYKKKVALEISGADTEVDKKMLEEIKNPLMHLLRNAVDHGIEPTDERQARGKPETGIIKLSAWHEGDRIFIRVSDDGRGIDPQHIREQAVKKGLIDEEEADRLADDEVRHLIFLPGFSTSAIITDVSGRGVGMDVVRKNIEDNLKGQVVLSSEPDKGSEFTLILPLTLAVTPAVIVKAQDQMFALPASSVVLGLQIEPEEVKSVEGKEAIDLMDSVIPLVRLDEILGLPHNGTAAESSHLVNIVVLEYSYQKIAFLIEDIIKEQDIIVKPLEKPLLQINNIAGITILDNGEVVPILHVPDLMESARRSSTTLRPVSTVKKARTEKRKKILIVEDSLTTRELEKSIMVSIGYDVATAVDGVDALNKIASVKPDLIITDVQMPRMDGFLMTEKLKRDRKYKEIPIIMVTALAKDSEKKRGIEVGADAYIAKSDFDQTHLVGVIEQLIG
jgi:two-component system chemotaxis sensor kinase CheA